MTNKEYLQIERIGSGELISKLLVEFRKILKEELQDIKPKGDDTFISRQEVADMFHVSLVTVHSWMNVGILKPYKIGGKTRFILSEVRAAAKNSDEEYLKIRKA